MWDLPHRKPAQPRSRIETIFEIMAVDRIPRYRGLTCNRDQLASYESCCCSSWTLAKRTLCGGL
jgi:hypothetical protein